MGRTPGRRSACIGGGVAPAPLTTSGGRLSRDGNCSPWSNHIYESFCYCNAGSTGCSDLRHNPGLFHGPRSDVRQACHRATLPSSSEHFVVWRGVVSTICLGTFRFQRPRQFSLLISRASPSARPTSGARWSGWLDCCESGLPGFDAADCISLCS